MIVTQHARFTAMFRLLRQNDVVDIQDRLPFHRLEQEWQRHCGLRRADLLRTIEEMTLSGVFRQREISEGIAIELTDRGMLKMQRWLRPFGEFHWANPVGALIQQFNTRRVLARARQRTRRSTTPSKPRSSPGERRSIA